MDFQDLLKACAAGTMPRVKSTVPIKFSAGSKPTMCEGLVTVIKHTKGFQGCAVSFKGITYDVWFHAEKKDDKRSRYLADLEICPDLFDNSTEAKPKEK